MDIMNENVQAYVILIKKDKLTLDEVPQEFRDEVAKVLEVGSKILIALHK